MVKCIQPADWLVYINEDVAACLIASSSFITEDVFSEIPVRSEVTDILCSSSSFTPGSNIVKEVPW